MRAPLLLLVLAAAPAPRSWALGEGRGRGAPHGEALEEGVTIDWAQGLAEAQGSSAADLRLPSAEVARIKAERLARERAGERLRRALLGLPRARWPKGPPDKEELDQALGQAEVAAIDYGSDGSVTLRLRLKLSALPAAPVPPRGKK